jgi:myo-inositol 2-dehydrogenase/D-chiro-inositol 1-dehydrogenase/scyllo-inositol 2-dehydrogenase (NAD+)
MAGTHARTLASSGALELRYVIDRDLAAAAALAERLGAAAATDIDAALADEHVEAALIATPTPTHADLVERVAAAGRHVFVEKPLAGDLDAAGRAARAVERAGVYCQVGFQRRFDPAYVAARRRLQAGEVGKPEVLRLISRDPHPPARRFLRASGGLMVDFAIHDLDLARHLLGPVTEVRAVGAALIDPSLADEGLFDTAVALLRFADGALGVLEAGLRTGYGYEIRTEVVGSRGRLQVEVARAEALTLSDEHGVRYAPPADFEARFGAAYRAELEAFAGALRGGPRQGPDARDAVLSLGLALAAQSALETERPVDVRRYMEERG